MEQNTRLVSKNYQSENNSDYAKLAEKWQLVFEKFLSDNFEVAKSFPSRQKN
jgi:hypothetical protein